MYIENKNLCIYCFKEIETESEKCSECQDKSNSVLYPTALNEGTVLHERYIVGKVLGKGGFGITYLCYDPIDGKKVAIKEYFPDSLSHRDTGETTVSLYTDGRLDDFKKGESSFFNEAKTISRLSYNENIVKVFEIFSENGTSYYVMEYLEGTDLKERLMTKGIMSEDEILEIMDKVFDAVSAVHSLDFLHRDISPDNILLCDDGRVKLIDFGSARQVMGHEAKTLTVMLKHGFAPFEQYQTHGEQGPWTDIYSLGATIYYALTGHVPLDAPSRVDKPELDMTNISENLNWVLRGMLNIQPTNRFRSIREVRAAMENAKNLAQQGAVNAPVSNIPASGIPSSGIPMSGLPVSEIPTSAVGNIPNAPVNTNGGFNYAPSGKQPKQKKPREKKNGKKIALIVVGVIVALIVAGTAVSILSDPLDFRRKLLSSKYDYVCIYVNGYVRVEENGKWGFADEKGNIVVDFLYDEVGDFNEGLAGVKKDGKCGFIDEQGKAVVDFTYDEVGEYSNGYAAVKLREKWGFIDKSGKVAVEIQYEDANSFGSNFAVVKKDGAWGAINTYGDVVIPFNYSESSKVPWSLDDVRKVSDAYTKAFSDMGIEELDLKVYDDNNNTVISYDVEDILETYTYVYDSDKVVVRYIDTVYVPKAYYSSIGKEKTKEILEESAADYEGLSFCTITYYEEDEFIAVSLDFKDLDKLENVAQMGDMVTDKTSLISAELTESGYKEQGCTFKYATME